MARTSYALKEGCDRMRRAELADEVHVSNINAEFEGGGRHDGTELAGLQPALCIEPVGTSETAVVSGHRFLAKKVRKVSGDALGDLSRVHEHESCVVLGDERREPLVNLVPHFMRHHGFERGPRELDRNVHGPLVSNVDDAARCRGVRGAPRADEKSRDVLDGVLGRG